MSTPDHAAHAEFDPVALLGVRFAEAIASLEGTPDNAEEIDPSLVASKRPELADFQCNAAMGLGKRLGRQPRELAAEIVDRVDLGDLAEPLTADSIAGPGFINIRLSQGVLPRLLGRLDTPALGIEAPAEPETAVVDLCGVNLAKQMHVGHLRATVIGDALARVLERSGAKVIRQNHVGDWGLPIAMVTAKLIEEADAGRLSLEAISLNELDRLYKLAQHQCKADTLGLAVAQKYGLGPKIVAELEAQIDEAQTHLAHAKKTLVALQSGDARVVSVWERIYDVTMAACVETCGRLHARVTREDTAGESSYREELAGVVDDLSSRGVAEESDGALVVRVEGIDEPCIVRKSDGGFLYATTDMAAIRRRVQTLGASRVIYAVDARQSLHFRQVFGAANKAGYAHHSGGSDASLEHAAFGTVLGEDRRPFKTRSGENVRLAALIDESVERAGKAVSEKNPDLPGEERDRIAEAVGVAAIKYADLANDRAKDYVFSFDRMLAFEGDTGPYLLYAVVRVRSIFRKAQDAGIAFDPDAELLIEHPAEKLLAMKLLAYPGTVQRVAASLEPHRLCSYLFELAGLFSSFFDACPVLRAETDVTRDSRLRLSELTARVMTDGLETLGIPVLDRM
ncbi:MAG: arginine--tRNA ligase [Planctomycetota bacterium]